MGQQQTQEASERGAKPRQKRDAGSEQQHTHMCPASEGRPNERTSSPAQEQERGRKMEKRLGHHGGALERPRPFPLFRPRPADPG